MRPRKVLLYVSSSEQDISVMRFMLKTNRYRVLSATTSDQAVSLFTETAVDLVLVDYEMRPGSGAEIVTKLKELAGYVPMVLLGDPRTISGPMHDADGLWDKTRMPASELLERIKVMSAKKRGPRVGWKQRLVPA